MTTNEKIKVMQAFVEGKDIEYIIIGSPCDYWSTVVNPTWNWSKFEYRVKPKPTRLDMANEFWEKTFGIKNAFNENSCVYPTDSTACRACTVYKDGVCESKNWWNALVEEKGAAK